MPQAWATPTRICRNLRPPETGMGVPCGTSVVEPSWPSTFRPQQYARLSVVSPQVNRSPVLTCSQRCPPTTATGRVLQGLPQSCGPSNTLPIPSWPQVLRPQQKARPSVVTPQVWVPSPNPL